MNYEELKKIIESKEEVDKKVYNQLVKKYSKKTIDMFFEEYINEIDAEDDEKFKHIKYYIEQENERESSNLLNEKSKNSLPMNSDLVSVYLKEIGSYPLLEPKEERELALKLKELKDKQNELQITDDDLDKELLYIGYNKPNNTSRKKETKYVETLLISLKDKKEILNQKKSLSLSTTEIQKINELTEELDKKITYLEKLIQKLSIQDQYQKTFNKLVNSNLRLVVSIAKRYNGRGVPILDLIQEGNNGLIKAIERFDVTKGYKLSTYATWWIRQAIARDIYNNGSTIRKPVHLLEMTSKINKIEGYLTQRLGRKPTIDEIVEELNDDKIDANKIDEILKYCDEPASLATPIGEDQDTTLGDFIPDPTQNIENIAYQKNLRDIFEELFKTLTPREEKVIRLRFGIDDGQTKTLEEVGQEFNVTRERIRQIEAKALRKLRSPSRSKKIIDFLN